ATSTSTIYTLSLHDALPIFNHLFFKSAGAPGGAVTFYGEKVFCAPRQSMERAAIFSCGEVAIGLFGLGQRTIFGERDVELEQRRSEEHTSELQSLAYLVCRL